MTVITLPPDIERPLSDEARRRGTTPERLAIDCLRRAFPVRAASATAVTGSITWLDAVEANAFDEWTRDRIVSEMPHTHFVGQIPSELAFLRGAFVDLGFENLSLLPAELHSVMLAFGGTGLGVPGSHHRLRHAAPGRSFVEAADGTEQATLPLHWKQGVLVVGGDDRFTWIGKRVRPDQIGPVDLSQYDDAGDGWALRTASDQTQP